MALVALVIMALMATLGILVDITGVLIRKQQLQTMLELGAAAGGRIISEKIAELANQNVAAGLVAPPNAVEAKYPEKFLTPIQRAWVQTDLGLRDAAADTTRDYALKNKPENFPPFDLRGDMDVIFPETYNDCVLQLPGKIISLKAVGRLRHPFILGKLAAALGSAEFLDLSATGLYSIRLCP